ncbi:uncharacterized protein LOC133137271 isoform X2 [Conger conger]|uniref:uncharacterized protein LOC133137271 isoform X2 n=1 Tax=Conger conger TaxID=82655 RepID=UPI002A5A6674|nr:uncharacterized protein LOC133137271 isoform X2 [Conger conger]
MLPALEGSSQQSETEFHSGRGVDHLRGRKQEQDPARMPLSVTKGEGVAVFTVTSDPGSKWPLLCQLLGMLCSSPGCFASCRPRKLMVGPLSSLATVQIMVGLFTIGLGANLLSLYDGPYFMYYNGAPYWLGACFIFSGIFTIIGDRFQNICLVFLTGVINVVSAVLAVVAIVFYLVDEGAVFDRTCLASDRDYSRYDYRGGYQRTPVNLTDAELRAKDTNLQFCQMYKNFVQPFAIGLKVLLVATAALQLCVTISEAVFAMKALNKNSKKQAPEVTYVG